jgi:hypothetical protein
VDLAPDDGELRECGVDELVMEVGVSAQGARTAVKASSSGKAARKE